MSKLRESFQAQFVTVANDRLKRALAALAADPAVVPAELHSLAGEAGVLGLTEISQVASKAMTSTASWRTSAPTSEQQLQCARTLRALMGLVGALGVAHGTLPPPVSRRRGPAALVIDDSELIADELASALREGGFEAAFASTVDGVMARLRERVPDVVLVDANMPGIDVPALCAQIRQHAGTIKLIVASAATDAEMKAFARHVGADGYVAKLHGTGPVVARARAALSEGGN